MEVDRTYYTENANSITFCCISRIFIQNLSKNANNLQLKFPAQILVEMEMKSFE